VNLEFVSNPELPSEFVGQNEGEPISIFINLSHMLREFNEKDYVFHICRGFLVEFICFKSRYFKKKLCKKDCIPHQITTDILKYLGIEPTNDIYYCEG
jgi:hypothetical protein